MWKSDTKMTPDIVLNILVSFSWHSGVDLVDFSRWRTPLGVFFFSRKVLAMISMVQVVPISFVMVDPSHVAREDKNSLVCYITFTYRDKKRDNKAHKDRGWRGKWQKREGTFKKVYDYWDLVICAFWCENILKPMHIRSLQKNLRKYILWKNDAC